MGATASQITSLTIVYSTVIQTQIKRPVTRKMFPFDDVIMHCPAPVTHSLQPVGDLLATKISGGRREVAGWLQGGRRLVGDRLQKVAATIWSQGGCCKWNLSATKSIVERFLVVADRSPTGWQLIADQLQRLQTIPTQYLVADWSPTSRRSVADRSPKKLQSFCIQKQTLKIQSPTSRRPIANRLPIAPQLIADWLPTDRLRVDIHCPITHDKHQVIKCTWTNVGFIFSKFQWH